MTQSQLLQRFVEITDRMAAVAEAKNSDYAGKPGDADAFANFRLIESVSGGDTTVEQGFLVRMSDKFIRVSNLTKRENKVADEKIEDTLLDLANYSILFLIYLESKGARV